MNPPQQQIKDDLLEKANQLLITNKELGYLLKEKENISQELIRVNQELSFQNAEKEKRAAELLIANKTLTFQNAEKENRAEELLMAIKELAYQIAKKERRADELILANKELAYQNLQKEINTSELLIKNTKLENTEKQLTEVNKELEAFSYSVSHDLRAPLRAISGYSEILREDYSTKLDTEGNRIIKVILDNTEMMSQLIDDLLTFSKMSRLELVSNAVDMKKLVMKSLADLSQFTSTDKYKITVDELPACRGDSAMLKQVWYNLIDNAIKYSSKKERPEITIGFRSDLTHLIYFVKDTGTGFEMQYANDLFGVFQRLHRQDEFQGTGLGLALAKRIINKHGGEIGAEATLHEGATFSFKILKT